MSENFADRPQDAGSAASRPEGSVPQDPPPNAPPRDVPPQGAPYQGPPPQGAGPGGPARRLERTTDGRMIAGVCSGAGAYLGVDPNIIRIGLAVLTVFGGTGIAAYAVAWLLIPEEGHRESIAQDLFNKTKQ